MPVFLGFDRKLCEILCSKQPMQTETFSACRERLAVNSVSFSGSTFRHRVLPLLGTQPKWLEQVGFYFKSLCLEEL